MHNKRLNTETLNYSLSSPRRGSYVNDGKSIFDVATRVLGEGAFGKVRPFNETDEFLVKSEKLTSEEQWETLDREVKYLSIYFGPLSTLIFYFDDSGERLKKADLSQYRNENLPIHYRLIKPNVKGVSLATALETYQDNVHNTLLLYINAAACLMKFHSKGMIHGDVNAHNLIVNLNSENMHFEMDLIDFGFTYSVAEKNEFVPATTTSSCPAHWPPERKGIILGSDRKPPQSDVKQDVFSFGSMPRNTPLPKLLKENLNLKAIFNQMRATDPADRPSMEEVLNILKQEYIKLYYPRLDIAEDVFDTKTVKTPEAKTAQSSSYSMARNDSFFADNHKASVEAKRAAIELVSAKYFLI